VRAIDPDALGMACEAAQTDEEWSELLAGHLRTLAQMAPLVVNRVGDGADGMSPGEAWEAAYKEYASSTYSPFLNILKASEGTNWLLPVLHRLVVNLRLLALHADRARLGTRNLHQQEGTVLELAEREIKRCFPLTVSDRAPLDQSKKWGAVTLINNLYKIYFQLNNLRQCKYLAPYVTQASFPAIERFPIGQQVTYRYFQGRLALLSAGYQKARDNLRFAFAHCPAHCQHNKRLALTYLIPCELIFGRAPSHALLVRHGLAQQYGNLVRAIRSGSLLLFDEALEQQQRFFEEKGIFFILERLRYITSRNLFRKVMLAYNNSKMPYIIFQAALSWLGVKMDTDEVECILANLIDQGLIKGYLSHKGSTLVVHKDPHTAFPALSTVIKGST